MLCIGDTVSAATALGALPVLLPSMQAEAVVDICQPQPCTLSPQRGQAMRGLARSYGVRTCTGSVARGEEVVVMRSLDCTNVIMRWRMIPKNGNRFPAQIKRKQNFSDGTDSN